METENRLPDGLLPPPPPPPPLRLALEPVKRPVVLDITETGEEIVEQPQTQAARFLENVARLDFVKILGLARENQRDAQEEENTEDKDVEEQTIAPMASIRNQIFYASEEIKLSLDLVRIMLQTAKHSQRSATPSMVRLLPAPRRPEIAAKRQIDDLHLNTARKYQHLEDVATFLSNAAARIEGTLRRDRSFYEQFVPSLRKQAWTLQAKGTNPSRRALYIDYGYGSAGSTGADADHAEIWRNVDETSSEEERNVDVELYIPHRSSKRLKIALVKNDGRRELQAPSTGYSLPQSVELSKGAEDVGERSILDSLVAAQLSMFDTEIYREISRTAPSTTRKRADGASESMSVMLGRKLALQVSLESLDDDRPDDASSTDSRENAFLGLIAERTMRRSQQNSKKQRDWGPAQIRPEDGVYTSLSRFVELNDARLYIQKAIIEETRRIVKRTRLKMRRELNSADGCDTRWCITLFDKWDIDVILDAKGKCFGGSSLSNTLPLQKENIGVFLFQQVSRVCLEVVAGEANTMKVYQGLIGSFPWSVGFMRADGMMKTSRGPSRCIVQAKGRSLSTGYLEFHVAHRDSNDKIPLTVDPANSEDEVDLRVIARRLLSGYLGDLPNHIARLPNG
ncbi:subunit 17 of mediator complex-domain-containing protein [Gaertneriomyces semiglobifer]|nr:subunit 17 of mediator complex-domain-containing protein [Gaertneriomyces semiglobifer]